MKNIFFIIIALLFIGAGCSKPVVPELNTSDNTETKEEQTTEKTIQTEETKETTTTESTTEQTSIAIEPITIQVIARQFEFVPSIITVKKGQNVTLKIQNIDVDHGFALPEFKINKQLVPNTTTEINFTPDKSGSFSFFCNVFCGAGHSQMRGTLVVE